MKQWLKLTVALATGLMMSACGNKLDEMFKKDPLRNQPDEVRNAVPGVNKTENGDLSDKDAVINTENNASFFSFVEGAQGQASFTATILVDGYKPEVVVENLDDFKGATITRNGKNFVFTWAPPIGIVPTTDPLVMRLVVVLLFKGPNDKVMRSKQREIPIYVVTNRTASWFVADSNLPTSPMQEGSSWIFQVAVHSTDPITSSPTAPTLYFLPGVSVGSNSVDISSTLSLQGVTQDPRDQSKWNFRVKIDLSNRFNLTDGAASGIFRLVAVSAAGIATAPRDYSIQLLSALANPVADFDPVREVISVKVGTKLSKTIWFVDPNKKGSLSVVASAINPADINVQCSTSANQVSAVCLLTWDIPATTLPGSYSVNLTATNRSRDGRSQYLSLPVRIEVTP